MSRATILARARAFAERELFTDACVIRRKTGETTSGGVVTPTYSDVYTGACRMQIRQTAPQGTDVGEAYLVIARRELQLPIGTPALREGDEVTMTGSATNAALTGNKYKVRDDPEKSDGAYRPITVIEVGS